jgi:prepilin-type N-terminal cleavage/methylation domain-containing protein
LTPGSAIRDDHGTGEAGMTLIELLVVLAILVVVLGGLATLFVSAIRSETDQTNRVQAQQDARVALDQLRREIHCGSAVSSNGNSGVSNAGTWPAQAITVVLPSYCSSNTAGSASVTWCTSASAPYTLWRYPHSTDLSGSDYAAACTGTGRAWVHDIVNAGGVSGGQIFSTPVTPTPPAMLDPDLAYGTTSPSPGLGLGASDVTYAYVVDPVTTASPPWPAGEKPGTENILTIRAGTINKSILLDWTTACSVYPLKSSITSFKIYGRFPGAEQFLGSVSSTACGTTVFTDDGATAPSGSSPMGSTRAKLTVDIAARADSSNVRLIELKDDITLRNTPR